MNRDSIIAIIKQHEADLHVFGVVSLSVFGSTARDEAGRDSDVDVAVILPPRDDEGGFAYLGRLDRIKAYLASILAVPVDVIAEPTNHSRLKQQFDRDRHLAF
jgi:uncharacterized protein